MAARSGAREGASPRGSAGLLARPDRPAAPRGRRRAGAPGGGEGARRPESWVRVGPGRPGRIGRSAGRRLRARRGEGAGARPAEGPPRSRPQPAARPPPGAPLGLADLPGEPSPLPPRVTATPCARACAQPSAPRAPRARTPLPGGTLGGLARPGLAGPAPRAPQAPSGRPEGPWSSRSAEAGNPRTGGVCGGHGSEGEAWVRLLVPARRDGAGNPLGTFSGEQSIWGKRQLTAPLIVAYNTRPLAPPGAGTAPNPLWMQEASRAPHPKRTLSKS